jgi:ABC-type multidrug transport system fused ATPase/permease subunit
MITKKEQLGLKIFLGVFILLMVTIHSHSRMFLNRGDDFYDDGSGGSGTSSISIIRSNSTIRTGIIVGAGYFLDSYSDMILLLNKIEMSDLNRVDYNDLRGTLYSAIEKMEGAKEAYTFLKQSAEITPYNQEKINRLISFDYTGFQETEAINSTICKDVDLYLKAGDITGLFGRTLSDMETILEMLYQVKMTIDNDQLPENSPLWKLNRKYSETMQDGQYAAEIFYAVTDQK